MDKGKNYLKLEDECVDWVAGEIFGLNLDYETELKVIDGVLPIIGDILEHYEISPEFDLMPVITGSVRDYLSYVEGIAC